MFAVGDRNSKMHARLSMSIISLLEKLAVTKKNINYITVQLLFYRMLKILSYWSAIRKALKLGQTSVLWNMTNCLHFPTTKSLFPRCYSSHRDPLLSGILLHDRHPGNSDKIDVKEMTTRIKLKILPLISAFSVPYLCNFFGLFFTS